ncbi:MAG TPA: hypothetical protein VMS43_03265 [Allosphingosinicella sp.]|nr:hypothetical protein [Allosphingosinicella sp.]
MKRPASPLRWLLALLLLVAAPGPALAAVEIAFYSRELGGSSFPHAFIVLRGTLDATGEPIDTSLGFTAHSVTPALLFGSVRGEVVVQDERQIARSDRQFALIVTDDQYRAAMAVAERWRALPQPSYNLSRANCVWFVSEIAAAIGLRVEITQRLSKRPRSFLQGLIRLNPQLAPPARLGG